MGNTSSTTLDPGPTTAAVTQSECPVSQRTNDACPSGTSGSRSASDECPMKSKAPLSCTSEELDPKNLMFKEDQAPAPSQKQTLSTDRQTSSIPQAGAGRNWVYPSPQMFFNAMRKKGWDANEDDMATIVAIHNNVNERTWQKIMAWESLRPETSTKVQLLRFCGRPTDLTPKARLKTLLGQQAPFDRHDWVVERDGREVRYVIDYYAYEPNNGLPPTTLIDARPALDSVDSVVDRFRMRYYVLRRRYWPFPATPSAPET